jgi:hypothetical protein
MLRRAYKSGLAIRNVHRVRRRLSDGEYNTHYYHRHTRRKLPGRPGSSEFLAAYRAAEQDWMTRKSAPRSEY